MLAVAAVLAFASCVKSEDAVVKELAGDWYYETVEADTPVQVYVSFAKDMTFELYQKVGDGVHRSITGRYSVNAEKKTISGMYEDNYPWKYDYKFEIKDNTLVLSAVSDTYSVVYTRGAIPAEVRQMSLPLVKSVSAQLPRCL